MPFQKGNPGRPKGAKNKATQALREMILEALHDEGGVQYLRGLATTQPAAFASLLGKVLPTQLTGEEGGAIKHEFVWSGENEAAAAPMVVEFVEAAGNA